jgi:hypothetical protein
MRLHVCFYSRPQPDPALREEGTAFAPDVIILTTHDLPTNRLIPVCHVPYLGDMTFMLEQLYFERVRTDVHEL